MGKFLKDFRDFAMRGNVIDMAVGVIVGGAFGKIVTSLVNDIIMPAVGVLTGGANFSEFKYVIQNEVVNGQTQEVITPEVAITWGSLCSDDYRLHYHRILYFCGHPLYAEPAPQKRGRGACTRTCRTYSGGTPHRDPRPACKAE